VVKAAAKSRPRSSPEEEGAGRVCRPADEFDGGRYRIRTYDFHRVKMALYR
jgi:hypothetical protein